MDFQLDEMSLDVQRLCRDFAAKEIAPYAAEWSEAKTFPTAVFRKLGDLGLTGMLIDEQYGGSGAGLVTYVAAMEQLGQADQSFAAGWNAHSTIASLPLALFGNEEQKERWLRPLAEGRNLGAFGLTEPGAGSDAAGIATKAVRDGDGWILNGTKIFITNAGTDITLGVTVLARLADAEPGGRRRFGVFFVPTGTPGYTTGSPMQKLGWHALDTRELVFDNCYVDGSHLIGAEGAGLAQFMKALEPGRVSVAALSLSLAQTALRLATEHARQRRQFGKPLAQFQAIAHLLADMATEVESARWLVYRAAWLADAGLPFGREAAMAKLYASNVANRAASSSVQIHGGYGYMTESSISRFYADAKILEIGEGTSEIQREIISRHLLA